MSQLYNHSAERYEKAKQTKCPRCRGFGRISGDSDEPCFVCNGIGTTWKSVNNNGWYRPIYAKVLNSVLY